MNKTLVVMKGYDLRHFIFLTEEIQNDTHIYYLDESLTRSGAIKYYNSNREAISAIKRKFKVRKIKNKTNFMFSSWGCYQYFFQIVK